jgi:hypothetical protein
MLTQEPLALSPIQAGGADELGNDAVAEHRHLLFLLFGHDNPLENGFATP